MKLIRSALFVPGNRAAWIEKAVGSGADALVLDLEDSVPDGEKEAARVTTRSGIQGLRGRVPYVSVRTNGFATGLAEADLEAIVCPELDAVLLPKVETVADMQRLDDLLKNLELRHGLSVGQIETPLLCETAQAMRNLYDIASTCPRVKQATLAAGRGGDAARAIGYQWSKEGLETLYLRSKTVLDCRAAGIDYPTIISWLNVSDPEGLRRDAQLNRQLGFRGMMVIHPSHVRIVNEVFSPSAEEVRYNQGLIEAMETARAQGRAAVTYQGDMVDEAMLKTAREILELAAQIARNG